MTDLFPSSPVKHKFMKTARHLNVFWVNCLDLPQSVACLALLVVLGCLSVPEMALAPLPQWVHLSACLATLLVRFLRVCPIQPHLHLLMWMLILSCVALSHCSSLLITFHHNVILHNYMSHMSQPGKCLPVAQRSEHLTSV